MVLSITVFIRGLLNWVRYNVTMLISNPAIEKTKAIVLNFDILIYLFISIVPGDFTHPVIASLGHPLFAARKEGIRKIKIEILHPLYGLP
jgi:predicted nucleotidyltransferase